MAEQKAAKKATTKKATTKKATATKATKKAATTKAATKGTKRGTGTARSYDGFSAEERAAMKDRAEELKAERSGGRDAGERAVLAKIAEMPEPDRAMAQRLHEVITNAAPELAPRTWYGMPAYAKDGKVVCYFTPASKFKERYSTFGFNAAANLDEGTMWPTSFALTKLTAADEARIRDLVKRAVS